MKTNSSYTRVSSDKVREMAEARLENIRNDANIEADKLLKNHNENPPTGLWKFFSCYKTYDSIVEMRDDKFSNGDYSISYAASTIIERMNNKDNVSIVLKKIIRQCESAPEINISTDHWNLLT